MDKHYILFAGDYYYPSGGWLDFKGRFLSIESAKNYLLQIKESYPYEWWHIVDEERNEIVEDSYWKSKK